MSPYTALKRMACNNSRWKAANQSDFKNTKLDRKKKHSLKEENVIIFFSFLSHFIKITPDCGGRGQKA